MSAHERFVEIRDAHAEKYGKEADWRCVLLLMYHELLRGPVDALTARMAPSAPRRHEWDWRSFLGMHPVDPSIPRKKDE